MDREISWQTVAERKAAGLTVNDRLFTLFVDCSIQRTVRCPTKDERIEQYSGSEAAHLFRKMTVQNG